LLSKVMPELPEVETTVTGAKSKILGLFFIDVKTNAKKLFRNVSFSNFSKTVVGKKIKNVRRRGKNIIIDINDNYSVLIHLKMTGHLLYGHWQKKGLGWTSKDRGALSDDKFNGHIRIVFHLSNGFDLALSDLRKFAKVELHKTKVLGSLLDSVLGPEPLDLSQREFNRIIKSRSGRIKQVLLDQANLVGVGNIYADESLYFAGIHPERKAASLNDGELKKLFSGLKTVFRKSIKLKGTSSSDYRDVLGQKGEFQNHLRAYKQNGQKCKRCKAIMVKIKVAGRGTHYCPNCQKL